MKTMFSDAYYGLITHGIYLISIPLVWAVISHLSLKTIAHLIIYTYTNHNAAFVIALLSASMATLYSLATFITSPKKLYLIDFACYNHHPSYTITRNQALGLMSPSLSPDSLAFTEKLLQRSGVSDNTFIHDWDVFPPKCNFSAGTREAETVISGAIDDLIAKTRVDPRDIGVVIVNISTFNPVPSLSAFIVNRYKLPQDVLTYNLGGMGCSAGIIAVDLARRLLQERRSSSTHALIMSLECPTSSNYLGNDRSKLVPMCLFRMGGAAVLLSNRPSDRRVAKYELQHTVRTHLGADDGAYNCIVQEPDGDDKVGITLSKNLMGVAGDALKANITSLGPLVLPISQQLHYLANLIARKVIKMKPFVPDFKLAFEHFCIHAGGKAVLDAVEKKLKLTEWEMEPSRMTLYRYSNTSSSSVWYELAYAEAKGRVNKGDRVWQIGFGSGFKCGSAVWKALRTIDPAQHHSPWTPIVHHFPVHQQI